MEFICILADTEEESILVSWNELEEALASTSQKKQNAFARNKKPKKFPISSKVTLA